MKNLLLVLFIGLTAMSLSSCSKKIHATKGEAQKEWKPRGQLYFVAPNGKYKGAVPCKDCPGIEVTLNFDKDNSVVKDMRYIQSATKNAKHTGTWIVTNGNIVQVTYPNNSNKEYYKAQNGGHLIMLNDKKELNINPAQAQFFIFNKD